MIVLCGSFGSISPCTLPRISSNGPTACPLFIGSREVISRRTTCARADAALDARMQPRRINLRRVRFIRALQGLRIVGAAAIRTGSVTFVGSDELNFIPPAIARIALTLLQELYVGGIIRLVDLRTLPVQHGCSVSEFDGISRSDRAASGDVRVQTEMAIESTYDVAENVDVLLGRVGIVRRHHTSSAQISEA